MRTEQIELGERQYTLKELPLRKASAWRANLATHFDGFAQLVESAPGIELNDMAAIGALMRTFSGALFQSVDTALELLIQYSPDLEKDRAYIEDNAVGSQVVDSFIAAVSLTFPFFGGDRVTRLTRSIQQIGSQNKPT